MNSFKFFTVGEPIGALVADRAPGVVGELGRVAPMVPIRVSINDKIYNYRSVRHPVLMPLLAAYLAQASHGALGQTFGDQSIALEMSVNYPSGSARVKAAFAGGMAVAEAGGFVAAVAAYLEGSTFDAPDVESVEIGLTVHEELRSATILEIVPDRRVVRPGDELSLRFRLQPHRGPEETRTLVLQVPENTPAGRLDVVGADGAAWTTYDLQMRPLRPASFAGELDLLNRLVPADTLVAFLERRDPGMAVSGGRLSAPPSRLHQLRSALGANLETTAYSVVSRASMPLPFLVSGAERISLTVVND
jgi:hypothetical protein